MEQISLLEHLLPAKYFHTEGGSAGHSSKIHTKIGLILCRSLYAFRWYNDQNCTKIIITVQPSGRFFLIHGGSACQTKKKKNNKLGSILMHNFIHFTMVQCQHTDR